MKGDVVMILGLPPILGFLPLVLYIILMMKGKDMNLSVLICVILGAVMTGAVSYTHLDCIRDRSDPFSDGTHAVR